MRTLNIEITLQNLSLTVLGNIPEVMATRATSDSGNTGRMTTLEALLDVASLCMVLAGLMSMIRIERSPKP